MQINQLFLFVSDLDGTLLPNLEAPAPAGCLGRTTDLLYALLDNNCPVTYCTGRSLSMALNAQEEFGLPSPTYWVCNVGTEIYDAGGQLVEDWAEYLGSPLDTECIQNALAEWPQVAVQDAMRNGPFKLSFTFPGIARPKQIIEWQQAVNAAHGPCKLVTSMDTLSGDTFLDFLADKSGKGNACHFLQERHSLSTNEVFYSGDSGNDLDALQCGFLGTLVGNADPTVKVQLQRGGGRVYIANAPYGDGVIEGIKHYELGE